MKGFFRFLSGLNAKWKYHTAKDNFHRKVAEINRYETQIKVEEQFFTLTPGGLRFNIRLHGFLIDRFEVLKKLSQSGVGQFQLLDDDVIFNTGDVRMRITTGEELFILYEIFLQNCYLIEVPEAQYSIVDIGMNVGFASLFFARNPAVKKVFAFEPFKPTFNNAVYNFDLNIPVSRKIIPVNYGLGLVEGFLGVPYSHELKGKNAISNGIGASMEGVEVRNACAVVEALIAEDPGINFYMKVDCEGSEFDIFRSFEGKVFPSRIRGIILEWHKLYPEEIIRYLKDNAFRIQIRGSQGIGIIVAFR